MIEPSFYDESYYLDGPSTGKSNYINYGWKPDLTLPMVDWLKRCLRIKDGDTVLDFGCARGYLVKAMRMRGVNAFGYDFSQWAIDNCDEGVKGYVSSEFPVNRVDHIIMKDVAEHIDHADLFPLLSRLFDLMRKSMLLIVPLTHEEDGDYLRKEDNSDPSHVIRWPLEKWLSSIEENVFSGPCDGVILSGSWHYPGLKPASLQTPRSCGFIHITRV